MNLMERLKKLLSDKLSVRELAENLPAPAADIELPPKKSYRKDR